MKAIERLYKFIFRDNLLLVSIIFAYLLFRIPIENLLSRTIVENVLSQIGQKWYNDIIFFFIFALIILLTIYRITDYTPSLKLTTWIFLITIFYSVYRISGTKWYFTSFASFSFLKYADTLILISISQAIIFFLSKKSHKNVDSENSFFDDPPLGENGEDILGYSSYAKVLAKKVMCSNFDKSFAIGINGKWGLGKTSFIDLLKREIKNDEIIEIYGVSIQYP